MRHDRQQRGKHPGVKSFFELRDENTLNGTISEREVTREFGDYLRRAIRDGRYRRWIEDGGTLSSYLDAYLDGKLQEEEDNESVR